MEAMRISLSGLDVEWQRLQVIAQNIANMNSTRTEDGDVYRPQRLVSGPDATFSGALAGGGAVLHPSGVRVMGVEAEANALERRYEPGHPHADADGFVTTPKIDHAREMTELIKASRAYEANLSAIGIAQEMYSKAVDLGRQA